MQECVFFLESRETVQMVVNQQGQLRTRREIDCGIGVSSERPGQRFYRWYPLTGDGEMPAALPITAYETALAMHGPRASLMFDSDHLTHNLLLTANELNKAGVRAELSVHSYDQQVAISQAAGWQYDQRRYATLGVRIFVQASGKEKSISRSYAYPTLDALLAALPEQIGAICSLLPTATATLEAVPCPTGEMPVVLGPGHAAVFFHEVCGHPLEGDIVVNQTSYLAPWIGKRVAEDYVNLVDDPTPSAAKLSYRIDDEGTPSRPVYLIEHGIVREPLLDLYSARHLDLEPNGHGRRLDFRHYAIPRMAHTQVLPHQGTCESALETIQWGILVSRLKLRHMNIASGDFSFMLVEARLIEDGRVGPYVSNGLLRGNGLRCLREIDVVGEDDERFLNAGGGCGKLDQWPVVVSFGQPAIRFRSLQVEPW